MLPGETQRCLAHASTAFRIAGNLPHGLDRGRRACNAHCRARTDGIVGGLGKVEGMRPDNHRDADTARFDEVVTAERQQAAADECDAGRGVIHRHLAHRIAE